MHALFNSGETGKKSIPNAFGPNTVLAPADDNQPFAVDQAMRFLAALFAHLVKIGDGLQITQMGFLAFVLQACDFAQVFHAAGVAARQCQFVLLAQNKHLIRFRIARQQRSIRPAFEVQGFATFDENLLELAHCGQRAPRAGAFGRVVVAHLARSFAGEFFVGRFRSR